MADSPDAEKKQEALLSLMGQLPYGYSEWSAESDAKQFVEHGAEATKEGLAFPAVAGQSAAETVEYLNQRYGLQFKDKKIFTLSGDGQKIVVAPEDMWDFKNIMGDSKIVSALLLRDLGMESADVPPKEANLALRNQNDAAHILGSNPGTQRDNWGRPLHGTDINSSEIKPEEIVKQADGKLAVALATELTPAEQAQLSITDLKIDGKPYLEIKDNKTLIISPEALIGNHPEVIEDVYRFRAMAETKQKAREFFKGSYDVDVTVNAVEDRTYSWKAYELQPHVAFNDISGDKADALNERYNVQIFEKTADNKLVLNNLHAVLGTSYRHSPEQVQHSLIARDLDMAFKNQGGYSYRTNTPAKQDDEQTQRLEDAAYILKEGCIAWNSTSGHNIFEEEGRDKITKVGNELHVALPAALTAEEEKDIADNLPKDFKPEAGEIDLKGGQTLAVDSDAIIKNPNLAYYITDIYSYSNAKASATSKTEAVISSAAEFKDHMHIEGTQLVFSVPPGSDVAQFAKQLNTDFNTKYTKDTTKRGFSPTSVEKELFEAKDGKLIVDTFQMDDFSNQFNDKRLALAVRAISAVAVNSAPPKNADPAMQSAEDLKYMLSGNAGTNGVDGLVDPKDIKIVKDADGKMALQVALPHTFSADEIQKLDLRNDAYTGKMPFSVEDHFSIKDGNTLIISEPGEVLKAPDTVQDIIGSSVKESYIDRIKPLLTNGEFDIDTSNGKFSPVFRYHEVTIFTGNMDRDTTSLLAVFLNDKYFPGGAPGKGIQVFQEGDDFHYSTLVVRPEHCPQLEDLLRNKKDELASDIKLAQAATIIIDANVGDIHLHPMRDGKIGVGYVREYFSQEQRDSLTKELNAGQNPPLFSISNDHILHGAIVVNDHHAIINHPDTSIALIRNAVHICSAQSCIEQAKEDGVELTREGDHIVFPLKNGGNAEEIAKLLNEQEFKDNPIFKAQGGKLIVSNSDVHAEGMDLRIENNTTGHFDYLYLEKYGIKTPTPNPAAAPAIPAPVSPVPVLPTADPAKKDPAAVPAAPGSAADPAAKEKRYQEYAKRLGEILGKEVAISKVPLRPEEDRLQLNLGSTKKNVDALSRLADARNKAGITKEEVPLELLGTVGRPIGFNIAAIDAYDQKHGEGKFFEKLESVKTDLQAALKSETPAAGAVPDEKNKDDKSASATTTTSGAAGTAQNQGGAPQAGNGGKPKKTDDEGDWKSKISPEMIGGGLGLAALVLGMMGGMDFIMALIMAVVVAIAAPAVMKHFSGQKESDALPDYSSLFKQNQPEEAQVGMARQRSFGDLVQPEGGYAVRDMQQPPDQFRPTGTGIAVNATNPGQHVRGT